MKANIIQIQIQIQILQSDNLIIQFHYKKYLDYLVPQNIHF
jgi:hypothetical protein